MALRLLKRGLVGRTTRDAGNRLRRAWFRWRGRTRLLNALARRLSRLATAEARYARDLERLRAFTLNGELGDAAALLADESGGADAPPRAGATNGDNGENGDNGGASSPPPG